jgi:hypothetical protein
MGDVLYGPIFYIGNITAQSRNLSHWTMEWLESKHLYAGPSVYACTHLELALESLQKPLDEGKTPSLIIIDHSMAENNEISRFSDHVRSCLPECWIIDLVNPNSILPRDLTAFTLSAPVKRTDWEDILTHVFLMASSPQWSRAMEL